MSKTKILPCEVCRVPFQDKTYGQGQRVHNETDSGWRCTGCTRERLDDEVKSRAAKRKAAGR